MYINEIPPNTEITLSCFAGSKWIKFNLKTDKIQGEKAAKSIKDALKSRFVITEPARTQGKIINFPAEYKYDLSLATEGKLSVWNNVRVFNFQIKKPEKKVLIIASNEGSKRTDRRRSYRLRLEVTGEVKFNDGRGEAETALVKDVSATGVGIIATEKNTNAEIGEIIAVSFTEPKKNQSFTIRAKIVRKEKMSGGKTMYGAIIIGERTRTEISKFIERERKMVPQK